MSADVLMLIYPDLKDILKPDVEVPWQPGQLDRIEQFVRNGGALLVMGDHTTRDKDKSNRFNDALAPTAMRVRFDSATYQVGGWLNSYQALAHPATAGIADDRNQFGVTIGASVAAGWLARPLLIGQWGWNDPGHGYNPGDMGSYPDDPGRYEPGEKLDTTRIHCDHWDNLEWYQAEHKVEG